MSVDPALVRRAWTVLEPIHAVTYFAPAARSAFEAVGLRGFWRGYYAGRAAPLGPVDAPVAAALFFGFAPAHVARALPTVWQRARPEAALGARLAGAEAALREAWTAGPERLEQPDPVASVGDLERAAHDAVGLLTVAVEGLECAGRPLAAANAALPQPEAPLAQLWQLATLVREHRGDGHVAALVAAGLDGCESLVWRSSLDLDRAVLQPARGWTDEQWLAAAGRLRSRGWLDAWGTASDVAREAQVQVEAATDRAAAGPWERLGTERTAALLDLLDPLAERAATVLAWPNPIGLPAHHRS